ncbi:MAG: hypothetical protein AAB664_02920, partial [Patescibacteria group bacterium]
MFKKKGKFENSLIFVSTQKQNFALKNSTSSFPIDTLIEPTNSTHSGKYETLHTNFSHKRLRVGLVFMMVIFLFFLARSFYLQIIQGNTYHSLADKNRYRTTRIVPPRGKILDKNGVILAENIPSFLLTMTIGNLPKDPSVREETISRLCEIAGVQRADIDFLLTQYADRPEEKIPILQKISFESAMRLDIEIAKYPGFELQTSTQRYYPSAALSLSHILGYTGKITRSEYEALRDKEYRSIDSIGKTGVEKNAESFLRGTTGKQISEVNASGHELSVISKTDPISGSNVLLSIDLEFQKWIEIVEQEPVQTINKNIGLILNPHNFAQEMILTLDQGVNEISDALKL